MSIQTELRMANSETFHLWRYFCSQRLHNETFREYLTDFVETFGGDTDCNTEVAEIGELENALRQRIDSVSPSNGLASPFDGLLFIAISCVDWNLIARCLLNEVEKEENDAA